MVGITRSKVITCFYLPYVPPLFTFFLLVVGVPNLRHGSASSLEYTQQPLEHCGDIIDHKGNPIFEPDMSL